MPITQKIVNKTPDAGLSSIKPKPNKFPKFVLADEELTEAGKRKRQEKFVGNPPTIPFLQPNSAGVDNVENSKNEPTDFGVRQQENTGTPRQDQEYTQEDIAAGQQQLAGDASTGRADEVVRKADVAYVDPDMMGATIDPSTGQVVGDVEGDTTVVEKVRKATTPDDLDASTVDTEKAAEGVKEITDDTTAQTMDKEDATKVEAQVKERQKKDPVTGEPIHAGTTPLETRTSELIRYAFNSAKLDGFNYDTSIGENKQFTASFSTEIDPDDLSKGLFISGFLSDQTLEEFHLLETTGAMDGSTGDFERFHLELEESSGLLVDNYIPLY